MGEADLSVFEPDGWECRCRIGLLVPDADVGPEAEWSALTPPGMLFNVSRFHFPVRPVAVSGDKISMHSVDFVANPGPLEDAVRLLAPLKVEAVSLAFTSNSYVAEDDELVPRLSEIVHGRPVVTTGHAFLAAVEHLQAKRVLLVDPPWFPAELTEMGRAWLVRKGVNVVRAEVSTLPSGQGNIHPGSVHRWLSETIRREADDIDLVLIGGNGFRAISAIHAVEEDTGVAVVSANTALMWQTLRVLGRDTRQVERYGRLFRST